MEEQFIGNESKFVPVDLKGVHVPLRDSLKIFLEIPHMFDKIMNYIGKLKKESYIISNTIQAQLWIKKYATKFGDTVVLPLYLYFDDIEVGNPLGSHAGVNKFGVVYASIACLPPEISARLNSILFSTIFFTEDKKKQ